MKIEEIVASNIVRHSLLDKHRKHIVALSGGADSVALLLILINLGYDVEAVHCNFHLRGAESDRDENFVKSLCVSKAVPLHLVHFDTLGYAELHKVSIEMAARELRYDYFEKLRCDIGAATICVAHHRDDNVETIVMNLIRGTGMRGLAGIRPVNGAVVRPLLCLSRHDIERYLADLGQTYVTDSTNLIDDVVRKKLRLNIIPLLKEINPAFSDNVCRTAEYASDAMCILNAAVSDAASRIITRYDEGLSLDIRRLADEVSPAYLLYEILRQYGFSSAQSEAVYSNLNASSGRIYSSSAGYELLIDRGHIIIEKSAQPFKPVAILEDGTYIVCAEHKLKLVLQPIDAGFSISRSAAIATFDASKVRFPLTLRPVREGDRFVPFGMKGTKLVSDYLTDRKKTLFQKRRQLVLTDATDAIIWLVGERSDNRFRITASTAKALVVSWI